MPSFFRGRGLLRSSEPFAMLVIEGSWRSRLYGGKQSEAVSAAWVILRDDGDHNCPGQQKEHIPGIIDVLWERVSEAEGKVCRVEELHKAVVSNIEQYDPISNVRYATPIKVCAVCPEEYPCTTIRTMNGQWAIAI